MRRHGRGRGESGQMAVELAVLMPVVIVVSLVVYNLARFVTTCAAFDRVALLSVTTCGASSSGGTDALAPVNEVRQSIEQALKNSDRCSVEVRAEPIRRGLMRFTCHLLYKPWPRSFVVAGVYYEAPFALRHERSLVVCRRSVEGVV